MNSSGFDSRIERSLTSLDDPFVYRPSYRTGIGLRKCTHAVTDMPTSE